MPKQSDIGLRLAIEGEKAFKQSLAEINSTFKVLGSEMILVTSQFDKNDKSAAALTSRNTVLNKEISAQKDKIDTLRSALENASTSFGENDRRTQNWQIQLNKAQAELNNLERELVKNGGALESNTKQTDDNRSALQKLVEYSKSGESATERLGNSAKGTGEALREVGGKIKDTAVSVRDSAKEFASDVVEKGKEKWNGFKDVVSALKNPLNLVGSGLESLTSKLKGSDTEALKTAKDSDKLEKQLPPTQISRQRLPNISSYQPPPSRPAKASYSRCAGVHGCTN